MHADMQYYKEQQSQYPPPPTPTQQIVLLLKSATSLSGTTLNVMMFSNQQPEPMCVEPDIIHFCILVRCPS